MNLSQLKRREFEGRVAPCTSQGESELPDERGIDPEYGRRMAVLPGVFGLKDVEFAASLGINRDRWWTYKAGKSRPRKDVMKRLHERYGITADYVWLGLVDGIRDDDIRKKIMLALSESGG